MQMKVGTAVILAAGMGTRLQGMGESIPKGFIQLGETPIIEESIERLIECGIHNIIIVTGHLSDFYDHLKKRYSHQMITTIQNPYYAESGTMYSLYCARGLIKDDFILLESDLIYEQLALSTILDFPKDNVVLLSGPTNAGDEVYVETVGETIVAMSKKKRDLGQRISGELVGISKISYALFQNLIGFASLRFEESLKVDYETDALVAVSNRYSVYYTVVKDLLWSEIDDVSHLARARDKIYPAILQKESQIVD